MVWKHEILTAIESLLVLYLIYCLSYPISGFVLGMHLDFMLTITCGK